ITEVDILMRSLPFTMPLGSKRVKTKASTNSSSGTPCCSPSEIAIAKQFIREPMALAEVLGHHPLGHLLGHRLDVGGHRALLLLVGGGVERLRELRAVPVEGHRLDHAPPGQIGR